MANWPSNPDWIPISEINNGLEITGADGFLASDQNKIVSDLQFLYNHLTTQHVYVGNITTKTGAEKTEANVVIKSRVVDVPDEGGETTEVYLDFEFTIPRGTSAKFGTPTASAHAVNPKATPTVEVTATGDDEHKVFDFDFGIPKAFDIKVDYTDIAANAVPTVDKTESDDAITFTFHLPVAPTVGTVSTKTLAAGSNAAVSVTPNASGNLNFSFSIPKGDKGDKGDGGEDGADYLLMTTTYKQTTDPVKNATFIANASNFNRTPVVNDTFIGILYNSTELTTYIMTGKVTGISGTNITCQIIDFLDAAGVTSTFAQVDGSYPKLGAGYLPNVKILRGTSYAGWYKIGSVDFNNIGTKNTSLSVILFINGLFPDQDAGYDSGYSGKIEVDFRTLSSGAGFNNAKISILSGNLREQDICVTYSGTVAYLYYNLELNYESIQVIKNGECSNNSIANTKLPIFNFENTYYGTTAPSGAVYAVNRNFASEAEIVNSVHSAGIGSNTNINNYYGADYWGKEYYFSGGYNPQGSPEGISGGHLSVIRAGSFTTIQVIRTGVGSDFSGLPTTYQRYWNGSVWTDWEEIVTADGSYPKLGAGYLPYWSARAEGSAQVGWHLIASIENRAPYGNRVYSCILLVNGSYPQQGEDNAEESGKLEIDVRLASTEYSGLHLSVLSGNINPNEYCAVIEGTTLKVYANLPRSYATRTFVIQSEMIEKYLAVGTLQTQDTFYGTTAPSGAVYAVIRNKASEADNAFYKRVHVKSSNPFLDAFIEFKTTNKSVVNSISTLKAQLDEAGYGKVTAGTFARAFGDAYNSKQHACSVWGADCDSSFLNIYFTEPETDMTGGGQYYSSSNCTVEEIWIK